MSKWFILSENYTILYQIKVGSASIKCLKKCSNLPKNKKIITFDQFVFFVLILILMIRQISLLTIGVNSIASVLFLASFGCFLLLFVSCFVERRKFSFVYFLVFLIYILLIIFLGEKVFRYFSDVLPFLLVLLALSMAYTENSFLEKHIKFYHFFVTVTSILLVLGAFIPTNYESNLLLYYTINPNQSGLLLLCYFINLNVLRW